MMCKNVLFLSGPISSDMPDLECLYIETIPFLWNWSEQREQVRSEVAVDCLERSSLIRIEQDLLCCVVLST